MAAPGNSAWSFISRSRQRIDAGETEEKAVELELDRFISERGKIVAGFGHRFHPVSIRAQ